MALELIGEVPDKTFPGQLLEYRPKIRVLGGTRWVTKTTEVTKTISFVERQSTSPYKALVHPHFLADSG